MKTKENSRQRKEKSEGGGKMNGKAFLLAMALIAFMLAACGGGNSGRQATGENGGGAPIPLGDEVMGEAPPDYADMAEAHEAAAGQGAYTETVIIDPASGEPAVWGFFDVDFIVVRDRRAPSGWRELRPGDEFRGLILERIYHSTVEVENGRHFMNDPAAAVFSGEIIATGKLHIDLAGASQPHEDWFLFWISEAYHDRFPQLTGDRNNDGIVFNISNRTETMELLGLTRGETGRTLIIADATASFADYEAIGGRRDDPTHRARLTGIISSSGISLTDREW
jgi:hypothetical protein